MKRNLINCNGVTYLIEERLPINGENAFLIIFESDDDIPSFISNIIVEIDDIGGKIIKLFTSYYGEMINYDDLDALSLNDIDQLMYDQNIKFYTIIHNASNNQL